MSSYELNDVDRVTVGTVGEPGRRVFLLQARQGGEQVTLKVEKGQVRALAEYLGELLEGLPRVGHLPAEDTLELEEPTDAEWVVGTLGITYVEELDRLLLVAEEAVAEGDDTGEEARLFLTREQAGALAIRGTRLVEAGRPSSTSTTASSVPRARAAKERFERAAWSEAQHAVQERIEFYDARVLECVDRLRARVRRSRRSTPPPGSEAKLQLHRPARRPLAAGARRDVLQLGDHADPAPHLRRQRPDLRPRHDLDRGHRVGSADLPQLLPAATGRLQESFERDLPRLRLGSAPSPTSIATSSRSCGDRAARGGPWTHVEPNHQIQVLGSAFYRNKAAYVLGTIVNGHEELPFVDPRPPRRRTAGSSSTRSCSTAEQINILFSLSRAYFMVDMEVPSGYVEFLRSMSPDANRGPSSTR